MLISFIIAEKTIVEIAILCWINSHKRATSLIFENCFDDDFLLSCCELQKRMQILLLNPVDVSHIFQLIINFIGYSLDLGLLVLAFLRIIFCLLSLWLVVAPEFWLDQPNQIESILDQIRLDFQI